MIRYPTLEKHACWLPSAVGDTCAILPIFREIHNNYPGLDFTFIAPPNLYKFVRTLAAEHGYTKNTHVVNGRWKDRLRDLKFAGRAYQQDGYAATSLRRNMTEGAFINILDASISDLDISKAFKYLESSRHKSPIGDSDQKYIVAVGTTLLSVRALPEVAYEQLIIEAEERDFKVAWVGSGTPKISQELLSKGLNLIDKTKDVYELFNIFRARNVVGFMGPDCGPGHVASCVKFLPIFTYYTTVDKHHRAPLRSSKIFDYTATANVNCASCQTRSIFRYDHDFRTCVERPEETLKPRCVQDPAWSGEPQEQFKKWMKGVELYAKTFSV